MSDPFDPVPVVTRIRFVLRHWGKLKWRQAFYVLRHGLLFGCYVSTDLSSRVSGVWHDGRP